MCCREKKTFIAQCELANKTIDGKDAEIEELKAQVAAQEKEVKEVRAARDTQIEQLNGEHLAALEARERELRDAKVWIIE
jgi:hypothetical protein